MEVVGPCGRLHRRQLARLRGLCGFGRDSRICGGRRIFPSPTWGTVGVGCCGHPCSVRGFDLLPREATDFSTTATQNCGISHIGGVDTDASPSPSNPSSDGGHQESISLVPTEMGHEGVIEEEYRTDENSAARRNIATDDIDRAPSAGAGLATLETKPLVVVPKAFHTGRFDKGEGGDESPGRVAMGDRDGYYIASFPSPSAAITAAVKIISSRGQASRPNRLQRPARAPPTVEETNDHGGKRVMSPPLSSRVVRQ